MRRLPKAIKWTLLIICVLLIYNGVIHIVHMRENYVREIKKIRYKMDDYYFIPKDFYWLWNDTLELYQRNEKCGEWGGDIERIRVFFKSEKLFGYYTKEIYNCDTLEIVGDQDPITSRTKDIEFTKKQVKLLKGAILDLTENKLNKIEYAGHSGISNTIKTIGNDERLSILIEDYPSFEWYKFHKLKNKLLKQNSR